MNFLLVYNEKYQFIACDDSAVDIFRNPGAPDTFFEPNGKSTCGFNQVRINAFYSILDQKEMDCCVERILTRTQAKRKWSRPDLSDQYRHICQAVPMDYLDESRNEYDISLRIVRFEISPGCFENIITNLSELEFDFEDFKDLYHMRWNEENSFRDLKYPLCFKAFHSKKYEYIVQEIWACAILHNFSSAIISDVEIEKHKTK